MESSCQCCREPKETTQHFISECPACPTVKIRIFRIPYISLQQIIEENGIHKLIEFITKSGRIDPTFQHNRVYRNCHFSSHSKYQSRTSGSDHSTRTVPHTSEPQTVCFTARAEILSCSVTHRVSILRLHKPCITSLTYRSSSYNPRILSTHPAQGT